MKYACKNEVMAAVLVIATSKQRFMSHFDTFFFLFLSIEQTLRSKRCKKMLLCVSMKHRITTTRKRDQVNDNKKSLNLFNHR